MTEEMIALYKKSADLYLLSLESNATPTTVDNRTCRLQSFLDALERNQRELAKSEADIAAAVLLWKHDLYVGGMKTSSIAQYMIELHAFFEWAVEHSFYTSNPVKSVDIPKVEKNPYTNLLSEEDWKRLMRDERPKGAKVSTWARNRAIVLVLLTSDMRNSELRALTLQDLDYEHSQILIRNGKGGKVRFVPFPELAQIAVQKYLATNYRPLGLKSSDLLFGCFGRHGSGYEWKEMDRTALSQLVGRYVKSTTNHEQTVRTHALRHAGASILVTSGCAMEDVQAILGHSNLKTTKIYAQRLVQDKRPIAASNRIWDEAAYQARKGKSELDRMARERNSAETGADAP